MEVGKLLRNDSQTSLTNMTIEDKNDPNSVKFFAYSVCAEYLGGTWKSIDIADFEIHKISYNTLFIIVVYFVLRENGLKW